MSIRDYRELVVWQKAIELAKLVYSITNTFPSEEKFGLVSQMRRAAVSVPSNIAEGQARATTGEFLQFISYAEGSIADLDTNFTLCVELDFCKKSKVEPSLNLILEIREMLNALKRGFKRTGLTPVIFQPQFTEPQSHLNSPQSLIKNHEL